MVVLSCLCLPGQYVDWDLDIGSSACGYMYICNQVMDTLPNGNLVLTGAHHTDGPHLCILCVDRETGDTIWSYQDPDNTYGTAIAVNQGHIYTLGLWSSPTEVHLVVLKIDAGGNLVWRRVIGEPGVNLDLPIRILFDSHDNLYVVGAIEVAPGQDVDIFLSSLTQTGVLRWEKTWGSKYRLLDAAMDAAMDRDGNLYLAGLTNRSFCPQGKPLLLKFDSSGSLKWFFVEDYPFLPHMGDYRNIELTADGGIYVDSKYQWEAVGVVEVFTPDGVPFQMKKFDDEFAGPVGVDQDGYLYFIGVRQYGEGTVIRKMTPAFGPVWEYRGADKMDFLDMAVDSLENVFTGGSSSGDTLTVMKLTGFGQMSWTFTRNLGGPLANNGVYAVVPDNKGGVFAVGNLVGADTVTHIYIVHLADSQQGTSEDSAVALISFVPVPSGFIISGYSGPLSVYDATGRLLLSRDIKGKTLVSPLNPGVYFVKAGKQKIKVAVR